MSADAESSADASLGYSREPDGDAEFAHELALALSHTPLPCSPPAGDAEFAHELALALSQPPLPCSPPAGDAEFARKLAEAEASSPSPPSGDEEYARELAEAASSPANIAVASPNFLWVLNFPLLKSNKNPKKYSLIL